MSYGTKDLISVLTSTGSEVEIGLARAHGGGSLYLVVVLSKCECWTNASAGVPFKGMWSFTCYGCKTKVYMKMLFETGDFTGCTPVLRGNELRTKNWLKGILGPDTEFSVDWGFGEES